ncbi:unnamed protein product [Arabidopsis halleri]
MLGNRRGRQIKLWCSGVRDGEVSSGCEDREGINTKAARKCGSAKVVKENDSLVKRSWGQDLKSHFKY